MAFAAGVRKSRTRNRTHLTGVKMCDVLTVHHAVCMQEPSAKMHIGKGMDDALWPELERIDVLNRFDVDVMCATMKCDRRDVYAAVSAVGNRIEDVRAYLQRRDR